LKILGELSASDWRRLNGLLELALERSPDELDAWFAQLVPANADLVPLLRRMIAESMERDAELSLPPLGGPMQSHAGDLVGPYRLVRELGRGGMAVVWLADRIDGTLERQVALKIPSTEWTDQGLAERIRSECAVLASLNHPNIAQLYDAGWSDSKAPYLALEFVDGVSIGEYCSARALDVPARVRLFIDVLRAVSYAHARLVVHRDLKPANVLVTHDGRVKLLDFGIAKVLSSEASAGGESELTRVSGRPITLAYAAPEQVLGKPVTTATDIYALGVMLCELLTGQRPFRNASGTRTAIEDALERGDAPLPSSLADRPAVARALRGDLDMIVRKALRKDPEQRFETAAAFADDLDRTLSGQPIRAQRGGSWYLLRRFVRRNRLPLGAGAGVIAAIVAGLCLALVESRRAEQQAENAAAIGSFVLSVIQQADPDATQETRASDLALLQTLAERIGKDLPQRPDLRFSLRLAVATAYRNRGEPAPATTLLRAALADAHSAPQLAPLDVLRARALLGETSDDDHERTAMLDPTIVALRAIGAPAAAVLVDALIARKRSDMIGDPNADGDLREALAVAQANLGLRDERTLRAADMLANMLGPGVREKNDEALAVLEPVIRAVMAAHSLPPGNPTLLHAESNYGRLLCVLGRTDVGLALLDQVVATAIERHHDGKELRSAMLYLARGQKNAGQMNAALGTLSSIYALLASRSPYGERLRYFYGNDLSHALLQARRPLEAEPFVEETRVFRNALPAGESKLRAEAEFQIGHRMLWIHLLLGEYEIALRQGESLVAQFQADHNPYYEYVADLFMGDIYLANGRPAEAQAAAEAALRYALSSGQRADDQAMIYATLSRIFLARGNAAQALAITDQQADKPAGSAAIDADLADFHLARGRALLALNRAAEAQKPLAQAYEFWRQFDATGIGLRRVTYWYAQALRAGGDAERSRQLHPPDRPPGDFPPPARGAIEAARSLAPQARIAAVLSRYPRRADLDALIALGPAAAGH
jgi:serine/threonine-protein kinase